MTIHSQPSPWFLEGTLAERPASAPAGYRYFATDTQQEFVSVGAAPGSISWVATSARAVATSTANAAPGGAVTSTTPAGKLVANAGDLAFNVTNPYVLGVNDQVMLALASTPVGAPSFGVRALVAGAFLVTFSGPAPAGFTLAFEIINAAA